MKKYYVFCLAIFLGGCAWADDDPTSPCLTLLENDPRVKPLLEKMPFDLTKSQSLEILSNKTKPNSKEKAALSFFAAEVERCADLGVTWRQQNFPPAINALLLTYRVDLVSAYAELYAGNITFGDLAKLRAKKASEIRVNAEAAMREIQAEAAANEKSRIDAENQKNLAEKQANEQRELLAQQQRFAQQLENQRVEESRRQAALQFLMNQKPYQPYTPVQPYMLPTNRPTTNCTSQWVGNQWQTVCR